MTRDTDDCVAPSYSERADLQARVTMANTMKPDLFISIHNNATTNPDMNGTAVYYSDENPKHNESARLANATLNAITGTLNTSKLGVKEEDFYVLRNTTMPSVLIEVAYISNSDEEQRLKNPYFRRM
jgi:N-acetylmuramoyl-L-alanine amidase